MHEVWQTSSKTSFQFSNVDYEIKVNPSFVPSANILPVDTVIPFDDPHHMGITVLYLLICSWVIVCFQFAINEFEPFGDKALPLIQNKCAHINRFWWQSPTINSKQMCSYQQHGQE